LRICGPDLHGYADPGRQVEVVTLRVLAVARTSKPRHARAKLTRGDGREAYLGPQRIFENGKWNRGTLYDRALLRPGDRLAGPAVIVELSATTYLPSRWSASVDALDNLVLAPEGTREKRREKP